MGQVIKTNDARHSITAEELYEIECHRESETMELSRARFLRNTDHLNEHNRGGDSQVGRVVINRLCEPLADAISNFIDPKVKGPGWNAGNKAAVRVALKSFGLSPMEYAYCTLKAVLHEYFRPNSGSMLVRHCDAVVEAIVVSAEFAEFKSEEEKEAARMVKSVQRKKGGLNNVYGVKTLRAARKLVGLAERRGFGAAGRLPIGAKLIELLIGSTGAFHLKKEYRGKGDTPMLLEATEELINLVKTCSDCFAELQPQYRAMVVPPTKWTQMFNGGYKLPLASLHPALIKQRGQTLRMLKGRDISKVYDAVNAIQETPWQINKQVLEVAQALWDMGGGIGGIPQLEDRKTPPFPWNPEYSREEFNVWKEENKTVYRKWADAAQVVHKFNRSVGAARLRVSYQLKIAHENSPFSAIYFPHTCDFRGRVYPLPYYVNPQSDDLGKALLMFADGKPLGAQGAYWLSIHLANCAGVDKVPFEERIAWVHEHERDIVAYAENPLDNLGWADMDSPFQFLAAAMDYAGYLKTGVSHLSHLPVAMDGTCNGLQHLSAMLKDSVGGAAVNLVPSMQPADIYTEVLEELKRILVQVQTTADDPTDRHMAEEWLPHMTRNLVKRPVMTTPYGVRAFGIRDQILEQIIENGWFTGHVIKYTTWALWLTTRMQEAITNVIVAAPNAMTWMQEAARSVAAVDKNQQGIYWTVPGTGFPVIQRYLAPKGKQIELFIGSQRVQVSSGEEDERQVDRRRQVDGISPNVIHSLDAAMLMLTVSKLKAQGIHSYALIHDSYGTHACDIPVLNQVLREQFTELYGSRDVLGELKATWEAEHDITLPELPQSGDLDVRMVNYSRYFFA